MQWTEEFPTEITGPLNVISVEVGNLLSKSWEMVANVLPPPRALHRMESGSSKALSFSKNYCCFVQDQP